MVVSSERLSNPQKSASQSILQQFCGQNANKNDKTTASTTLPLSPSDSSMHPLAKAKDLGVISSKQPSNPQKIRRPQQPATTIFQAKRGAKAVKQNPAYLLTTASTAPWYFRAAVGGGSCPVILKRMMGALSRAFEGDGEPSPHQERRQKKPSSGLAKLQRRRLMGTHLRR